MNCEHVPIRRHALLAPIFFLLLGLLAASAQAIPAKVALIHSFPVLGDAQANLSTLNSLVEEALLNGANIVVTPESATTGFSITRTEVLAGLGFTDPYPELSVIRGLAIQHQGYVAVAIAEVTMTGEVYNTVALFGPNGLETTRQKRGLSGWHDRGIIPFDIIPTPYGDLGMMICSDVYLPDWIRIAALKGADLVLLPANWWGQGGQEQIWQTRARESSVWFFTANRWGTEVDTRFGFPFTYFMDDAPSAFITPDGEIQLIHRAEDDPVPADTILYYDVDVPQYRIGTDLNPGYSMNFRRPEAYGEIANLFYRPDLGNQMVPGLPPDGTTRIASITYKPKLFSPATNMATVEQIWTDSGETADVVVLPGLGITSIPIDASNPNWPQASHWLDLQNFVENNGILLLATTVLEQGGGGSLPQSLVILRPGQAPQLSRQIHDSLLGEGSGAEPIYLDLPHARVGLLTGRDALFPETSTHLAKSGIDILLIPSSVGAESTNNDVNAPNYFWNPDALHRLWRTRTNHVFHLAASDWTGNGVAIEVTGGIIGNLETADAANPAVALDTITNSDPFSFDSVRVKFLNAYYPFDLDALLGQ